MSSNYPPPQQPSTTRAVMDLRPGQIYIDSSVIESPCYRAVVAVYLFHAPQCNLLHVVTTDDVLTYGTDESVEVLVDEHCAELIDIHGGGS